MERWTRECVLDVLSMTILWTLRTRGLCEMIEICTVIGVAVISIVVAVVIFHILVIGYVLIEKIVDSNESD
jgi:ABC-type dipeptide/oligopeptide/nickel transport system permease component